VGHRAGSVLVGRLPRQQSGESGAVPGSAGTRAGQRHRRRDRPTFPAPGSAETSARRHVHRRWTDGQATDGQPCTSIHIARQVRATHLRFYCFHASPVLLRIGPVHFQARRHLRQLSLATSLVLSVYFVLYTVTTKTDKLVFVYNADILTFMTRF